MEPNRNTDDTNSPVRIFVFGSNLKGIHGAGAAHHAYRVHGAKWGVGEGLSGFTYAIPTKDEKIRTRPLDDVRESVKKFVKFAKMNPHLEFYVTEIGCGLAGFSQTQIAPMFYHCLFLNNVKLPKKFLDVIAKGDYKEDKISYE